MLLSDYLSTLTCLSSDFLKSLSESVSEERVLPHQIICAAGQAETRVWFVGSGLLRRYFFDASGREHTVGFYKEDDLLFSLRGLEAHKSIYYVEALEYTALYTITYQAVNRLRTYPEANVILTRLLSRYDEQENFKKQLLLLSAPERYHLLRREQNWIFSRVSIKLIASYLHMTRENLSRLMSKS